MGEQEQQQATSATSTPVVPAVEENTDVFDAARQKEAARKYIAIQTQEIIIPSYAAWFELGQIHDIERRSLPEFFNNRNKSKTPSVYKDYRDFMVNTYRLNPLEYLTVTACRRNMTGDVCAIIRVHAFLEQWGLINYQVDPDLKPSNIGPPFSGQFKVVADTPKSFLSRGQHTTPEEPEIEKTVKEEVAKPTIKASANLELRRNIYESKESPGMKAKCESCGKECGKERYQNERGVRICHDCHKEGKVPPETTLEDFKADKSSKTTEPWTDQEEILLMEGLEMYSEDWNKIADHVGTRTRDECILHFLKLPMDDPYVDSEIEKLGLLQFDAANHTENPIMSVVAFLASTVKPDVAAAAGQQRAMPEHEKMESSTEAQEEEDEARQLTQKLFRTKLRHFEIKVAQYEKLESIVEEERRQLEKERHQLNNDRLALKSKLTQVYREIQKRGSAPSANSITPAQIQQQIAGGVMPSTAGPMYMNAGQHPQPHHIQIQQQQQYQLQMQRQMQAQQGHQFQQPPTGHNYNMMSF
ncbi:hypothetical protein BX666DRAFT_1848209 [Dichotomocladium elegans]|nr:hypothetical protein BX666DRAFT_1848209 [Dichotomocladium elegans]